MVPSMRYHSQYPSGWPSTTLPFDQIVSPLAWYLIVRPSIISSDYHDNKNTIQNSPGSALVNESQNVNIQLNYSTENEIEQFLEKIKNLPDDSIKNVIKPLTDEADKLLKNKEKNWESNLKSILYSIGGSVPANLISPSIKKFLGLE